MAKNEQERATKIHDDLAKLNSLAFLISEYKLIHRRVMRRRNMTPLDAHALTTCELIKKNNTNLQALLEDCGFTFPD